MNGCLTLFLSSPSDNNITRTASASLDAYYWLSILISATCAPGVQSDAEGTIWRDPPHYWEQIVYPAYVNAHCALFEGGDVERGRPSGAKAPGLVVLEGGDLGMDELVDRSCTVLLGALEGKGGDGE